MSLVRDLQAAAVDQSVDVLTLIRKAKLLATRLPYAPLAAWADHELLGYDEHSEIPRYRVLHVRFVGTFTDGFREVRNYPIDPGYFPFPEKTRELLVLHSFQALSSIVELLQSDAGQKFHMPLPQGMAAWLEGRVFADMTCMSVAREIQRGQLAGIVDGARTSLLNFSIEIEKMFPELAAKDTTVSDLKKPDMDKAFSIHVSGTGHVINAGNRDVVQSVQQTVSTGNVDELVAELRKLQVPEVDIVELKDVLVSESAPASMEALGPKASGWIGKMVGKAATGTWKVGVGAAGSFLARLLANYWGIP